MLPVTAHPFETSLIYKPLERLSLAKNVLMPVTKSAAPFNVHFACLIPNSHRFYFAHTPTIAPCTTFFFASIWYSLYCGYSCVLFMRLLLLFHVQTQVNYCRPVNGYNNRSTEQGVRACVRERKREEILYYSVSFFTFERKKIMNKNYPYSASKLAPATAVAAAVTRCAI